MNENRYGMIKDFFEKNNRFKIFKMLYIFSTALFVLVYAAILLKNIAKKEYKRLFCNIFAPGVTFGLCTIIRHKINRKRPYEEMNIEPLINKDKKGHSFPSRHVTSAFAIAVTAYHENKGLGMFSMFVAVIVAFVRVIAGVHYVKDVVAGMIFGSAVTKKIYDIVSTKHIT